MQTLQSIGVARQIAREHEASLRRPTLVVERPSRLRRWIGRQLVRTGTWLATERTHVPGAGQLTAA